MTNGEKVVCITEEQKETVKQLLIHAREVRTVLQEEGIMKTEEKYFELLDITIGWLK